MSQQTRPTTLALESNLNAPPRTPTLDYDYLTEGGVPLQTQMAHPLPAMQMPMQPPVAYLLPPVYTQSAIYDHLRNLATVDEITITQQQQVLADFPQHTSKYRCLVKSGMDANLFYAVLGTADGEPNVTILLYDTNRNVGIAMDRFDKNGLNNYVVSAPIGTQIGYLLKEQHCCSFCSVEDICIADGSKRKILSIESSMGELESEYKIYKYRDDEPVGAISHLKWGENGSYFKDVDVLKATFPAQLDLKFKAMVIATAVTVAFRRLCK